MKIFLPNVTDENLEESFNYEEEEKLTQSPRLESFS